MKNWIRSDLAMESDFAMRENLRKAGEYSEQRVGRILIERLTLDGQEIASQYGKEKGIYVTVHSAPFWQLDHEEEEMLVQIIATELRKLLIRVGKGTLVEEILVVGLGNREMTADSIGVCTVSNLTVTRHLQASSPNLFSALQHASISAICPGVLAQTGMESLELIRGAVDAISPKAVIVVDALAARDCQRLGSTIQLSDTGIVPGSGLGNHRLAISRKTLGVPVISMGVPTVADACTLAWEVLQSVSTGEALASAQELLKRREGYFVCPKESDLLVRRGGHIIAAAMDIAFSLS